jgi:hypothetical protein
LIHLGYKVTKCKSCISKPCHTKAEALERAACFAAEVAGRTLYLAERCDYVLPGSIARGSAAAEKGHVQKLADISIALANCTALAKVLPK